MASIRPQTAPKKRPVTAQQVRPLGRVATPLRKQVADHGSNPESVIAAIKGDLMTVQRRIDKAHMLDRSSSEMEFLERHLLNLNATTGDELATSETINTLLEMLVQRFNALSITALESCGETVNASPGRIGSFLALTDFVHSIAERKRLWDAAAPALRDSWSQPDDSELAMSAAATASKSRAVNPSLTRTSLEDALNEPAVSQLRRLIADQRDLQQQLQASLEHSNVAAAKAKEESLRVHHNADQAKRQIEQALAEVTKQRDSWQKRAQDLQAELQKKHSGTDHIPATLHHTTEENHENEAVLLQKAAGALAFGKLRATTAEAAGIDTKVLSLPASQDSEAAAARIASVIAELLHSGVDPLAGTKSRTKPGKTPANEGAVNTEGTLWWILSSQSEAVELLDNLVVKLQKELADTKLSGDNETARLNRVILALNERVNVIKANATREAERLKSFSVKAESMPAPSAIIAETVKPRIVDVKGQSQGAAERESTLHVRVNHQALCIQELQSQLATTQQALADEKRRIAANLRENTSLLQLTRGEATKTAQAQQNVAALESEIQSLRGAQQATKKELREKTAAEAELQQAKWKLEVELHIAQNVIAELRAREEQLNSNSKEANECRELMTANLTRERQVHAAEIASLKSQLAEAQSEERVAKQVLHNERSKMLEHEREVDRLRSLDLQMDVLEQNFTNYAACKLAQREAVEEEEKVLQNCVDNIGRDVFVLPTTLDSEEKVTLYLEKLKGAKAAFDAEDRSRKRQKATAVNWRDDRSGRKQLAQTMQQRYNAIQIFACEQRLRQIHFERTSDALQVELDEYRTRHESQLVELAHAKTQCDGLVQRNTELEMQRKEFIRGRLVAEQEIKGLKNTVHKMRITNEEQEKVLIDVGTRLQQSKGKDATSALSP
jgi:chromosome segregation ATPase